MVVVFGMVFFVGGAVFGGMWRSAVGVVFIWAYSYCVQLAIYGALLNDFFHNNSNINNIDNDNNNNNNYSNNNDTTYTYILFQRKTR